MSKKYQHAISIILFKNITHIFNMFQDRLATTKKTEGVKNKIITEIDKEEYWIRSLSKIVRITASFLKN